NKLQGEIPSWLWKFSSELKSLDLSDNKFEGPFSPTLVEIVLLDVSRNELSGHLEADIDERLGNVQIFLLAGNRFEGKIPASVGNISLLYVLDMSGNRFSGNVPSSMGALQYL
ncbi:hypothetical protein KI387_035819, partial [Taxus chinensis]